MQLKHLWIGLFLWALLLLVPWQVQAADVPGGDAAGLSAEEQAYVDKLRALKWVVGPATVDVDGNSQLTVPEGYRFLNKAETSKFLELNQNLSSGTEVMIAPASLQWSAYFSFADEGYVKDDEKLNAAAILKSLQEATEASNAERRRRGWPELQLVDWAIPPAYSSTTRRLEWATLLQSEGRRSVNFLTKILGRRGYTTVVLAASPEGLPAAQTALNSLLSGYRFKSGDTYAEYRPGDKVAEYGLAALVLGGAAAIATKKGLWAVLASALAAGWKFLAVGIVAVGAALRRFFTGKKAD
jgi:uncharacterized membrane-anchored protein